ncbi:MAG: HAD-IA family hydrolase [Defluviimonas sp.]|uniref:HAD-IA family hydrolase n=1 Tax=Albidovulum sp. TaxID=1872424 RepID=UPI001DD6B111|nr:HAD-IA family hydrolase [Paracoccaceae bacterium]MCC0063314.1 HAD-IA family hydrolase [Defluviimonas sp.]
MPAAEAVVFDIGNVLVEWHPERFYDSVMPAERRARLFAEVDLHAMNEAIDAGAPFRDTVDDWAARHAPWAQDIRRWYRNWADIAAPAIAPSARLLAALKRRGVTVAALSNIGAEPFALACRHYPFLSLFDRAFLSGPLGVTKPHPRIYEIVETETGIAPARLLFADDRAENIAAAAARGWQVHHFTGPGGLAERLVLDGLLSKEDIA